MAFRRTKDRILQNGFLCLMEKEIYRYDKYNVIFFVVGVFSYLCVNIFAFIC